MTARELLLREPGSKREWVEVVKGVAIILIVAYHTTLFLTSIGIEPIGLGRIKLLLELFPMPAFFLISGMFHFRVPTWSLADTWRRRLRQYLYLYLLWSVIRFVFYLVAPNVRSDGAGATASDPLALLGVLIWPISSYWFILALFVFTLVLWLAKWVPMWILVTAAAVLSALSSSGLFDVSNVGWNRMSEYLVFFLVGAWLHRGIYASAETMRWYKLVVPIVALGVLVVAIFAVRGLLSVPGVATLGQVLAVVIGIGAAVYVVRLRPFGWLVYVGQRTLNIYLVHIFVIALISAGLALIPGIDSSGRLGSLLTFAVAGVTVFLSIVITRYLTRISWLFVYPFGKKRGSRARPAEGGS